MDRHLRDVFCDLSVLSLVLTMKQRFLMDRSSVAHAERREQMLM